MEKNCLIKAIRQELNENLKLIPAKRSQVQDIIKELRNHKVLMLFPVRFINIGYNQYFGYLYSSYTEDQRKCLHIIHERMRIGDEIVVGFEKDIQNSITQGISKDPFVTYGNLLSDVLNNYETIEISIKNFLKGNIDEVLKLNSIF